MDEGCTQDRMPDFQKMAISNVSEKGVVKANWANQSILFVGLNLEILPLRNNAKILLYAHIQK